MAAGPPCIVCGATHSWPIGHAVDARVEAWRREAGLSRPYDWRLCRACGNGFPSEQPDRGVLARYWAANRETQAGREQEQWDYRLRIAEIGAQRTFDAYAAGRPPGRFLDVACGLGRTVRHFADRGWQAEGIDADPTTKQFHEELGIASRIGQVEDATFDGTFDLVQVAYAIYFVTDPREFLAGLKRLLSPGGRLAIVISDVMMATPVPGPAYAHTFYPTTARTMMAALALAGYVPRLLPSPRGSFYIEATPGAAEPPGSNAAALLLLYRTQALRWRLFGAPRAVAARLARRLTGRKG